MNGALSVPAASGNKRGGECKRRRGWRLMSLGLVLAAGCDAEVESKLNRPVEALRPRHPALLEAPPNAAGSQQRSRAPSGGLPPGHPPVSARSGSAAPSGAEKIPVAADGWMTVAGVSFLFPKDWINEAPESSFRLAQFRLPRADGDPEDGLMTVSLAGGQVESNIERWRDQFEGKPEPKQELVEIAGLRVTRVWIEGTYLGMAGPAGGGGRSASFALLGAVIERPGAQESLFFKGTGPQATMSRWREAFAALLASLKPPA